MAAVNPTIAERPLETPRLVLEPLVPSHAACVFEDLLDPELYRFIPREPPASLAALESRFRALSARASPDGREAWLNWVGRVRSSGACVGMFEATVHADRRAHLAYSVFPPHWRRGYAKEGCRRVIESLFADWNVEVVAAEIDTRNLASIRLVESLGFRRASFKPGADFFKGATSDEYRYELRRPQVPDGR